MKLLLLIFTYTSLFAIDVDSVINSISTPKNTMDNSSITSLKDPFEKPVVARDTNDTNSTPKPTFQLKAIFDNQVLIDGKWLKIGDSIMGYKLIQINKISAIIATKQDKKTLYLFKGAK